MLNEYWGTSDLTWHGHACLGGKPLGGLGERSAGLADLLAACLGAAFPGIDQP
jgi:hypothetical protein